MFQVKGIILGPDYLLREHAIYNGKVQNMDPWSMDPLRGPGPWTGSIKLWTGSMDPLSWTGSMDPLFLQVEVAP